MMNGRMKRFDVLLCWKLVPLIPLAGLMPQVCAMQTARACSPTSNPGACDDGTGATACSAVPGASDKRHLTVTGTGFVATGACVYILKPSGTLKGDIVTHGGGGGTNPMTVFNHDSTAAGFRVTDIAWDSPWEDTGVGHPGSILVAAGKVAAVLDWIYLNIRGSAASTAFCGEGFSGGSSAMLYAMTHYGEGDSKLDHVIVLATTPFGRIDLGCDSTTPAMATVCPSVTISPVYNSAVAPAVGNWTHDTHCGNASPPASSTSAWQAQSIVSPGEQTAFTKTSLSAFFCQNNPNGTIAQGTLVFGGSNENLTMTLPNAFYNQDGTVRCAAGVACDPEIVCAPLTSSCSGEAVYTDPTMKAEIISDMQNNCINRHTQRTH